MRKESENNPPLRNTILSSIELKHLQIDVLIM